MKKSILLILVVSFFVSCSSEKIIENSFVRISEKEECLINNNLSYPAVSIVGGAGILIANQKRENREKRYQDLQKIKGVEISFLSKKEKDELEDKDSIGGNTSDFEDANEVDQFKATILSDILFDFNSYELTDSSKIIINKLHQFVSEEPEAKLKIIGHTDNVGGREYNDSLSWNRARSVAEIFIENGFYEKNITLRGRGFYLPVKSNATPEGRRQNRRVEIIVMLKKI
ncbi:membrane protein [Bacteroidia bacterium]|nr:membrane protein [Bacteroidia bacterium]GHT61558.1 membrane protein [Bacteroidia bacterium]